MKRFLRFVLGFFLPPRTSAKPLCRGGWCVVVVVVGVVSVGVVIVVFIAAPLIYNFFFSVVGWHVCSFVGPKQIFFCSRRSGRPPARAPAPIPPVSSCSDYKSWCWDHNRHSFAADFSFSTISKMKFFVSSTSLQFLSNHSS